MMKRVRNGFKDRRVANERESLVVKCDDENKDGDDEAEKGLKLFKWASLDKTCKKVLFLILFPLHYHCLLLKLILFFESSRKKVKN